MSSDAAYSAKCGMYGCQFRVHMLPRLFSVFSEQSLYSVESPQVPSSCSPQVCRLHCGMSLIAGLPSLGEAVFHLC